jgi:hypothetical protein
MMKDSRIRLRADVYFGEGKVKMPPDWRGLDPVLRADLLRDWLYDLQEEYIQAVNKIVGDDETVH